MELLGKSGHSTPRSECYCAHFTLSSYWASLGTQLRGVIEHDCTLRGVTAPVRSLYSAELLRKFEDSTPRSY